MDWDWPQFLHDIRQLCAWSARLGDTWQLINDAADPAGADEGCTYMRKQLKLRQRLSQKTDSTSDKTIADVVEAPPLVEPEDVCCTSPNGPSNATIGDDGDTGGFVWLTYDFHVLFHRSYRVPVLCFNASHPDGRQLTLDEAWQLFCDRHDDDARLHFALTQMDHPVLFRPFHTVHPCRTAELLEQAASRGGRAAANRVLSFVSAIGPFVHLHMDLRYGRMQLMDAVGDDDADAE